MIIICNNNDIDYLIKYHKAKFITRVVICLVLIFHSFQIVIMNEY